MQGTSEITIPQELRKKYPELVELIVESETLDHEDREYWITLLPLMSDEHITRLTEILQNEKDQLLAIEEKYQKKKESSIKETGQKQKSQRAERKSAEQPERKRSEEAVEDILEQIDEL